MVSKLNPHCSRIAFLSLPLVNTLEVSHILAGLSLRGLKLLSEVLVS